MFLRDGGFAPEYHGVPGSPPSSEVVGEIDILYQTRIDEPCRREAAADRGYPVHPRRDWSPDAANTVDLTPRPMRRRRTQRVPRSTRRRPLPIGGGQG